MFSPIPYGTTQWDVPLNAALADLQDQITANLGVLVHNVKDYGAVGDGAADDTAAIQAALDAASGQGGGTVFFPGGATYAISNYLEIVSNTTVLAHGATIRTIANHGLVRFYRAGETYSGYDGHSHILIEGGTWDVNAYDGTVGVTQGMLVGFTFGHNDDVTLRDVTVTNVASAHALDVVASQNVRVLNCRFLGFLDNTADSSRGFSEAIQLDAALASSGGAEAYDNTMTRNVLVQGCYFAASDRLGGFGRAVGSHTSVDADSHYENIQIIGNRIESTLMEGVRPYAWRNAVIADNIITGTGDSCIIITGPDPAATVYAVTSHRITVHGNTCEPNGVTPIRVVGFAAAMPTHISIFGNTVTGGTGSAIYVDYAAEPSITANHVYQAATTGIYLSNCTTPSVRANAVTDADYGIGLDDCTGGHVEGNSVTRVTGYGIFVGSSTALTIASNRVEAAGDKGIRVTTNASGCTVMGNRVTGGGVNGIQVTASATGCVVVDNVLTGNGWDAATGLSIDGGAILDWAGGSTVPGTNLVS